MYSSPLKAQVQILIETYLLSIQTNKILGSNYYLQILLKIIFDLEIFSEPLLDKNHVHFYYLHQNMNLGKIVKKQKQPLAEKPVPQSH